MSVARKSKSLQGDVTTALYRLRPEDILVRGSIIAIQSHPRFLEAARSYVAGISEMYGRNRLWNRVLNDRGRVIGAMLALYLHYARSTNEKGTGLTLGRFQAICVDQGVCSSGRARALLMQMRLIGYLDLMPGESDRRQRQLVPTAKFIAVHHQRALCHFQAIALINNEMKQVIEVCDRPEFMPAYYRHLGESYLAGFRLLHFAPELAPFCESNSGLLLLSSLFLDAADGPATSQSSVPLSISALSARFGFARAHARKLLAEADRVGLARRAEGSHVVIVLPKLLQVVGDFYAALFTFLARHAERAAEEVRGTPSTCRTEVAMARDYGGVLAATPRR